MLLTRWYGYFSKQFMLLWDGLKEDCHAWFHFQWLSRERISERSRE